VIADLGEKDYWLSAAEAVTNPFRGPGTRHPYDGKAYMSKHVGDTFDTSPYPSDNPPAVPPYKPAEPPQLINTSTFVANLGTLIRAAAS
jgi:hypothetical protein